ncbi:uncharacterized protein LOC18100380 isoform X2 [Populus trichocarpa]|uniref:uncharacterized protein LOC18100380 isoform X2 n=1 Tax=Populus trichocarpa TaxID=3694 RepID=UPI000D188BCF|nr:uncharacterized protein LOC18100380 isoform X2 [Populus trichocarpa]|eukprot:XP_024460357.1 uncharacterized protein LOC18100380 isoform X2 [Populus trichocarpa]
MPGAIEVSVLDFMGLQSSSPPSQMSIKVSMGKREYETRDKGDFIFPLTTLRENLIVTLQDAKGNEISHTGVETRLVIEKGIWDDTFPLEGGGHVRMKVQFVLSEADRHRIRLMRELALKKKHDELLSSEPRCPEYATAVDSRVASSSWPKHEVSDSRKRVFQSEVMATQVSLIVTPPTFSKSGKSCLDNREGTNCVLKQTSPNDPDKHEGSPSIAPVSQGFGANLNEESHKSLGKKRGTEPPPIDIPLKTIRSKEALYFGSSEPKVTASDKIPVKLKGHGDSVLGKQNPVNKTPSNDVKPKETPPPIKSASGRLEMEFSPKCFWSDEVRTEKNIPEQSLPGKDRSPYLIEDMQGASKNIREGEEHVGFVRAPTVATSSQGTGKSEEELSDASFRNKGSNIVLKNKLQLMDKADIGKKKTSDVLLRALVGDKASNSGRMLNEYLGKHPYCKLLAGKKNSGGTLLITNSGKETHSKDLERISIQEGSGDAHYSSECYGAWIFPYERRRLCITTAGTQILNLMGSFWDDTKAQPEKMSSSVAENMEELSVHGGTGIMSKEHEKTSQRQKKSKLRGSIDAETSGGPVGQVMRGVIMVGFATLVLLTRQKTR